MSGKSVLLQAVAMIDLPTLWGDPGWIEIHTLPLAQADLVSNQVLQAWLIYYLLPSKVIVDRGNEFLAKFREMIINDYIITVIPITPRKP